MRQPSGLPPPDVLKTCCASLYASDWVRLLLGDSLHPGGLALTDRLATLIALQAGQRLLDVGSGRGVSAIHLARQVGCEVVGVDYSAKSVASADRAASEAGVSARVRFLVGDAEHLPVGDHEFDAAIAECALCSFPDKNTAAAEFARVLRPAGRLGLSDLVRGRPLPPELEGLAAWVACIADARPVYEYVGLLERAGLRVERIEHHDDAFVDLVQTVRTRLLIAQMAGEVTSLSLPSLDWAQIRLMLRSAAAAIADGSLGYAVITAIGPELRVD